MKTQTYLTALFTSITSMELGNIIWTLLLILDLLMLTCRKKVDHVKNIKSLICASFKTYVAICWGFITNELLTEKCKDRRII